MVEPAYDFTTAWHGHKDRVRDLIVTSGARTVCEIGGGRSPLFEPDEVAELGLDYTLLDVSAEELALAPPGYQTLCADICDPTLVGRTDGFDVMFSKMVIEHVPDGPQMHRNVRAMLKPGGQAFHFYPTLWYPPYLINKFIPERLSGWALRTFANRPSPKFPARYSRCSGPTKRMTAFLRDQGYEIVEHRPFYGAEYFEKIPVAKQLDHALSAWAARRRNPYFTSFAYLVVRRPA